MLIKLKNEMLVRSYSSPQIEQLGRTLGYSKNYHSIAKEEIE
ncbi:MAG: hypothetical protein PHW41_00990 [Eubacteriales bacterium]|nr:hypothetical protein [Eubacteriales bacterium]